MGGEEITETTQQNIASIGKYRQELFDAMGDVQAKDIARVIKVLDDARMVGRRVYIFGNGGSASTASHFTSDLNKGASNPEKPKFRAFCLGDNTPALTAWANDTHYGMVFAEQLENFIEAGDVAIAISGSGNSPNVVNGVKLARAKRAFTIGFIGFDGGMLRGLVDIAIVVPSDIMQQVEDVHLILGHVITKCLKEMGGEN